MISIQNLTKRFGHFTAVDDISFSVEPGEIFGFLGAKRCRKDNNHSHDVRAFGTYQWRNSFKR